MPRIKSANTFQASCARNKPIHHKMEWIRKNLLDRAAVYENFLRERRTIIAELQKVHVKQRQTIGIDERLILQVLQQSLIQQMRELEDRTEQKFAEIRQRRNQLPPSI